LKPEEETLNINREIPITTISSMSENPFEFIKENIFLIFLYLF
jgi:hypothetical protein